jgi:hypothetical protein
MTNGLLELIDKLRLSYKNREHIFLEVIEATKKTFNPFCQDALEDVPKTMALRASFERLLTSAYWHRIWIWQEFIVSPDITLYHGKHRMRFDTFECMLMCIRFLHMHIYLHVDPILKSMGEDALRAQHPHLIPFLEYGLEEGRTDADDLTRLRHGYHKTKISGRDFPLFQLLVNTHIKHTCYVNDARDRIFALLGIATDADKLSIIPDYKDSSTCASVYTSVVCGRSFPTYTSPVNPGFPFCKTLTS